MIKLKRDNELIYFNPMTIKVVQPSIFTEDDKVYNRTYIECIDSTSYMVDEEINVVVRLINNALKKGRTVWAIIDRLKTILYNE